MPSEITNVMLEVNSLLKSSDLRSLFACFAAGYSMPQFCIDNDYKSPIIISDDINLLFFIHSQFEFDKRITPCYRTYTSKVQNLQSPPFNNVRFFSAFPLSENDISIIENSDIIIVLDNTQNTLYPSDKTIYIKDLVSIIGNYVFCERPLIGWKKAHPDVEIILMDYPRLFPEDAKDDFEKLITSRRVWDVHTRLQAGDDIQEYEPFQSLGYTRNEALRLTSFQLTHQNSDGSTILEDNDDELIQIHNGFRKTAYQEDDYISYKHVFWCMGHCLMFGYGAPYDKTFESYLQQLFNNDDSMKDYKVVNAGQFCSQRYQDNFYNLWNLPINSGDTVLLSLDNIHNSTVFPFFHAEDLFKYNHQFGHVMCDDGHLNENGYRGFAEKFYEWYIKSNRNAMTFPLFHPIHYYGIPHSHLNTLSKTSVLNCSIPIIDKELDAYIAQLSKNKPIIGSIVMNCNPFTNGHRYLVETASKQCDILYIFVVQEDKSQFPFADRFELVKKGTEDITNVKVLPSGRFILSSITFNDYFNKKNIQEKDVDSSIDVELFASAIAPALGITVRFVGEEPLDNVTRQYNDTMKKILPTYGINLIEIPRIESDGSVISASRVRLLLSQQRYPEIETLVPKTTYQYLIKQTSPEQYHPIYGSNKQRLFSKITYIFFPKNSPQRDFARNWYYKHFGIPQYDEYGNRKKGSS